MNDHPTRARNPDPGSLLDLDAIERRTGAATPGPWTAEHRGFDVYETQTDHGDVVAEAGLSTNDAAFIAAARSDVPALVAEVRRLRQQLDQSRLELSAAVESYTNMVEGMIEAEIGEGALALAMLRSMEGALDIVDQDRPRPVGQRLLVAFDAAPVDET